LHSALSRLLLIAPVSSQIAEAISERIQLIEKIEAGLAQDDMVIAFFSRISENITDFTQSQRAIAYYQIGHSYFSSGDDELATVALKLAIDLDSSYYNAWSLLGIVYDLSHQQERAVPALCEAIKLKSKYEFGHFNLGTIYERRGQLIEAAHSY